MAIDPATLPALPAYVRKPTGETYRVVAAGLMGASGPEGPTGPTGPQGELGKVIGWFGTKYPSDLPTDGIIPAGWDTPTSIPPNPPLAHKYITGEYILYEPVIGGETNPEWNDVYGYSELYKYWFRVGQLTAPAGPSGPPGPSGPSGPSGPPGPIGPLDILTDVTVPNPDDGQALVFQSSIKEWRAGTVKTKAEVIIDQFEPPPETIDILWGDESTILPFGRALDYSLEDLLDVKWQQGQAGGQVLVFDDTISQWTNRTPVVVATSPPYGPPAFKGQLWIQVTP